MAEQSELEVTTEETEAETVEVEEQETEEQKPEETEGEAQAEPEEPEELQVTIGEESPASEEAKEAPAWAKELRKRYRESQRELNELRQRVATPAEPKILKKPTLEACDYDEAKFEQAMDAYYRDKAAHDARQAEIEANARRAQEEAEQKRRSYAEAAQALKVKDFKAAQDEVIETLSSDQQALILAGADRPELIVYALGKNPAKLQELASIKDPAKFAVAIGKLEEKLKVTSTKSKAAPKPEPTVRSSSGVQSSEATLNRLREEAMRTGDMTKVIEFKRQMRAKST